MFGLERISSDMKEKYDVVVIGAGIGGLVCANYLSLNGKKILLVEKNSEPGGYCTSFNRRGFIFDTTIHAIQNCDRGNILNKIFTELNLASQIHLIRPNPTDTVILNHGAIHIWNDFELTLKDFINLFPQEKNALIKFFNLILREDLICIFSKYRTHTFQHLLDEYFESYEIKRIFGGFLSNIGSLPENTSCLAAFAVIKQFILSGGFYPKGGMQVIPNALMNNILNYGGKVLLNQEVKEILLENISVKGIKLASGQEIDAPNVVSNSDITNTYSQLINRSSPELSLRLKTMKPSFSIFIVYLTLDICLRDSYKSGAGVWYFPSTEALRSQINLIDNIMTNQTIFCSIASKLDSSLSPAGKDYMRIMVNTNHHNQEFWSQKSVEFSKRLIEQITKVIPISNHVTCVGRATSVTMKNYTLNRSGAVCGWLNSPEQVNDSIINHLPNIKGLYNVGHWVTQKYGNGGVAMAADSGRKVAKTILKTND